MNTRTHKKTTTWHVNCGGALKCSRRVNVGDVSAHKLVINFLPTILWRQPCLSCFIKFHHLPSAAQQWSAGRMAEGGSDARSYNLFPSYPRCLFWEERNGEWRDGCVCVCVRRRGNERNKWTHLLPKALLLQLIYQKGGFGGSWRNSFWLADYQRHSSLASTSPPIWHCHFG